MDYTLLVASADEAADPLSTSEVKGAPTIPAPGDTIITADLWHRNPAISGFIACRVLRVVHWRSQDDHTVVVEAVPASVDEPSQMQRELADRYIESGGQLAPYEGITATKLNEALHGPRLR